MVFAADNAIMIGRFYTIANICDFYDGFKHKIFCII